MSIQEELKAAVSGYMQNEGCSSATRVDALNAIDAFFRNLEEVEMRMHENTTNGHVWADAEWVGHCGGHGYPGPALAFLVRKPEPEMKQVTRETLAVLKEFYEETPQRTPEGDKAVAEVDRLLKGR